LAGNLPPGGYYTLCSDISRYAFCNLGTELQLDELARLDLIKPVSSVIDSVIWPTPTVGTSYARGLCDPNRIR
jgi:hypothetical protein